MVKIFRQRWESRGKNVWPLIPDVDCLLVSIFKCTQIARNFLPDTWDDTCGTKKQFFILWISWTKSWGHHSLQKNNIFDSFPLLIWQLEAHNDVMPPPPPKYKQMQYCHTFFNILWIKLCVPWLLIFWTFYFGNFFWFRTTLIFSYHKNRLQLLELHYIMVKCKMRYSSVESWCVFSDWP